MASFTPRTEQEIVESLLAQVVARSELTDTVKGSVLYNVLAAPAAELASCEYKLYQFRNSFDFRNKYISLADFKARLKELPGGGLEMLGQSAASGSVLTIVRDDDTQIQVIPSGMLVGRSDGSNLTYRTMVDVTFQIGITAVSGVYIACTTPGKDGNCGIGAISRSITAPDWVISVANTQPLANGTEAESMEQARHRAELYLSALGKSQKAAIEFLALSFVASDATKAKFAKAFVDPMVPGYGELVVDDGSGFTTLKKSVGAETQGTVPKGGQTIIVHPGPATKTIASIGVKRGGLAPIEVLKASAGQIVSVAESGYIYIPSGKSWSLQEGDVWLLHDFEYYVGYLAELQAAINGDVNGGLNAIGWSAFGCRVAVRAPDVQYVSMLVHVVPKTGVDLEDVQALALNVCAEFVGNLGPGEPLYVAALMAVLMTSPELLNVGLYESGTPTLVPLQDTYPAERKVLRTSKDLISFISSAV